MERYSNVVYTRTVDPSLEETSRKSNEIKFMSGRTKRPNMHVKLRKWRGTDEALDNLVMGAILGYLPKLKHSSSFSAEELGFYLNVKVDQVKQSLHRLNLKGEVSQRARSFAHDSNRAPFFWGTQSGWASNVYYLRKQTDSTG